MAAVTVRDAGKLWNSDPNVAMDQWVAQAGVALTAGTLVVLDTTTGRWVKAAATSAAAGRDWYMVRKTVAAGEFVTGYKGGAVEGFNLDSLDFRAPVYMSDTAGELADAAGTVSIIVGVVRNAGGNRPGTVPDKLLYLMPV